MGKIIKIDEAKRKREDKIKKARREAGVVEKLNALACDMAFLPSVGGYWSREDVSIFISPLEDDGRLLKVCVTLSSIPYMDLRGIKIFLHNLWAWEILDEGETNSCGQATFTHLPREWYRIEIADE